MIANYPKDYGFNQIGNLIAGRGERPFALTEEWQSRGERPFALTEEWQSYLILIPHCRCLRIQPTLAEFIKLICISVFT